MLVETFSDYETDAAAYHANAKEAPCWDFLSLPHPCPFQISEHLFEFEYS